MRNSGAATLLGLALAVTACGGGKKVEIDPNREALGTRWNATLATSKELLGAMQVKGTGWMADDKGDAS